MQTAEDQREIYAAALREAREERSNIDVQLQHYKVSAPAFLRVRRVALCKAIEGLEQLVKSLATC